MKCAFGIKSWDYLGQPAVRLKREKWYWILLLGVLDRKRTPSDGAGVKPGCKDSKGLGGNGVGRRGLNAFQVDSLEAVSTRKCSSAQAGLWMCLCRQPQKGEIPGNPYRLVPPTCPSVG